MFLFFVTIGKQNNCMELGRINPLRQETIAAQEAFLLLRRDPHKYALEVASLYCLSVKDWELGRVGRAANLFMRNIDDVLDGDRQVAEYPYEYAIKIRTQIETNNFTGDPPVVNLAQYSLEVLERKAKEEDDPRRDFLTEIDAMLFDYDRAKERRTLSKAELTTYFQETFSPITNIILISVESQLRATDISELAQCQGIIYSARDLNKDWNQGRVNIPEEILQEAGLSSLSTIAEVRRHPAIKNWFWHELVRTRAKLLQVQEKINKTSEKNTKMIFHVLTDQMQKLLSGQSNLVNSFI